MFGTSLHEKKLSRASPDDMGKTKNVTNKQQISAPSQTELQILFVLHNKKNENYLTNVDVVMLKNRYCGQAVL